MRSTCCATRSRKVKGVPSGCDPLQGLRRNWSKPQGPEVARFHGRVPGARPGSETGGANPPFPPPDDIEVRFYEDDENGWQAFGDFSPTDVHKQVRGDGGGSCRAPGWVGAP